MQCRNVELQQHDKGRKNLQQNISPCAVRRT